MLETNYSQFIYEIIEFRRNLDELKDRNLTIRIDPLTPISKVGDIIGKFIHNHQNKLPKLFKKELNKEIAVKDLKNKTKVPKFTQEKEQEWCKDYDDLLSRTVSCYSHNWKKIRTRMNRVLGKDLGIPYLKDKYFFLSLMKNEKKRRFSKLEDDNLIELVNEHGTNWILISSHLIDRTPIMIKNRYYYLKSCKNHRDEDKFQELYNL